MQKKRDDKNGIERGYEIKESACLRYLLTVLRDLFIFRDSLGKVLGLLKVAYKCLGDLQFLDFVSTDKLKDDKSADVTERWCLTKSAKK